MYNEIINKMKKDAIMSETEAKNPSLKFIADNSDFEIKPHQTHIAFEDNANYKKLDISLGQKAQLSMLVQQIPQMMGADTIAKAYKVSFPKGLPHTLTRLKQGGFSSLLRMNDRFIGTASLTPLTVQAIALGAFSALSAVTGQYFLKKINNELQIVSRKLDDILNFLYGDKKAELIAEIGFVKYAYSNYNTIMMSDDQRTATIISLQAAKKVAAKDIEFYITDFSATVNREPKDYTDLANTIDKTLQLKDSIEMSRQLFVVSSILELYYAQNFEENYMEYIEKEMIACVNKCDQELLGGLSRMQGVLSGSKLKPRKNETPKETFLEQINAAAEPYRRGSDAPIRIAMRDTLDTLGQKSEFFIDESGNVYTKNHQTERDL